MGRTSCATAGVYKLGEEVPTSILKGVVGTGVGMALWVT